MLKFDIVSNNKLAELIFREGSYKDLCKKLAGDLADDLHSEFIEAILKGGEGLDSAQREGYLNVYCVGIIHNIWGKRGRHRQQGNSETSPLFVYSSTLDLTAPIDYYIKSEDYNYDYDYKYTKASEILESEKNHEDPLRMYQASVFYYSNYKYKSMSEFSKESGISYKNIVLSCKEFKNRLKKKLKI